MIKAVIFDLDGTLLPMNEEKFTRGYFGLLYKNARPFGYEKELFVKTILTGTHFMKNNNGSKTNEKVFWDYFASIYGEDKLKDKAIFDKFYLTDFEKTKSFCGENPFAKEIVEYCKNKVGKVILASNPVFPKEAMDWRLKFAGLNPEDFDYVSDYSNSSYCKPNPMFLKEILRKLQLKEDEVVYFGNNEIEDGRPAEELGIKVYMVGDDIVEDEENSGKFDHIKFEDIMKII